MNWVCGSLHLPVCLSQSFSQHLFPLEGTQEEGGRETGLRHASSAVLLTRRMADFVSH